MGNSLYRDIERGEEVVVLASIMKPEFRTRG